MSEINISTCSPVEGTLCGEQGTVVMAIAYLDAHYQLSPGSCNQQVAVPWAWLARFAAELTYQSATYALCLAVDEPYSVPSAHHFRGLHSRWCDMASSGKEDADRQRVTSHCAKATPFWQPIDDVDPQGLMLRYPLGHPDRNVPSIPEGFVDHCDWPLLCRSLVATLCDTTIDALPPSSEHCINALRHLRSTAAAGDCLGDFDPSEPILEPDDSWFPLLHRPIADFDQPWDFGEVS